MDRKIFDEDEATVQSMLAEGYTDKAIAEHFGVHPRTVWWWRRQRGLKKSYKILRSFNEKYGEGALAKLKDMYDHGSRITAIAQEFGFTKQYASYVVSELLKKGILVDRYKRFGLYPVHPPKGDKNHSEFPS